MSYYKAFYHWMYRGHRPNWPARGLNKIGAIISSRGVTPGFFVTLEVIGRKSGRTISLPIAIAVVNKQRYLVSMLGGQVQWVQNVRAAGGKAVLRHGSAEEVVLEEIPVNQRAPIIKAYLQIAPGARPHIPVDKDAPLAAFEQIAADFPVFLITTPRTA